jgi:hypothetical protein
MKKLWAHEITIMKNLARAGESGMTGAELSYICGMKKMCEVYRPIRRLQGICYLEETDEARTSETSTKSSKKAPVFILTDLGMTALVDENWIFPTGSENVQLDEFTEDELDAAPNIADEWSEDELEEAPGLEDCLSIKEGTPFEATDPVRFALGNCELRAEAAIKSLTQDPAAALVHLQAIIAEARSAS